MKPYFDDGQVRLLHGHVMDVLRELPSESVQVCVTSPPYWSLRAYGTEAQVWGGDPEHEHEWGLPVVLTTDHKPTGKQATQHGTIDQRETLPVHATCPCGAWRGELGHEPTPQMFVSHLVEVFREVRRVLKSDGCCFVNLGDSYSGSGKGPTGHNGIGDQERRQGFGGGPNSGLYVNHAPASNKSIPAGLKPKDLVLIPERFALAMQEPYVVPTCVKSETDRAWLAAFMDGEGTVSIRSHKHPGQDWRADFVPFIGAGNNDIELLQHCVAITGLGSVRLKSAAGVDARAINSRRDNYGWRLDGNKAIDVIRAVYPHLIAKRKQAILAYTLDTLNKGDKVDRKTDEAWQKRAYLYELIKRCNQREPIDLPSWAVEPSPKVEPGWYVRSRIAWCKASPMPESVTDRPSSAWEHIFMFTKSAKYFWDQTAVREKGSGSKWSVRTPSGWDTAEGAHGAYHRNGRETSVATGETRDGGRNMWNYWVLGPDPSPEAHFATFPREIPRRCIAAATSERGECPQCGKSWVRVVERKPMVIARSGRAEQMGEYGKTQASGTMVEPASSTTTGWAPSCACNEPPIPSVVLDPFVGSGTTTMVARSMLRRSIGIDLSEEYLHDIALKKNAQMALMATLEPTA